MLCAHCTRSTQSSPCSECGGSPYLDGRYRLESRLSTTSGSTLYQGVEIMSRQKVALREFPLNGELTDELHAELERVSKAVQSVEHPAVVRQLAAFAGSNAGEPSWWVVRAWAEGTPLAERVKAGPSSADDVQRILRELVSLVGAFHRKNLVHGNIGPQTVLQLEGGRLVVAESSALSELLLSRGVGGDEPTSAARAPEEARGAARPASDLFRVGAVGAALMAGVPLDQLARDANGFSWPEKNKQAPALVALLDELTRADPARRTASAAAALEALAKVEENPVSLIGISSSWDVYEPEVTPSPAPPRRSSEADPAMETWAGGLPADAALTDETEPQAAAVAEPVPPPVKKRPTLPRPGQGPLPIGVPEPVAPRQDSGRSWMLMAGCGTVLLLSLVGGVGAGAWMALQESESATPQLAAAPAPAVAPIEDEVPPPTPAPEPAPVAPVPPAPEGEGASVMATEGMADVRPANPDHGLLRIRCERRVFIAVNGRVVDRTPLDLELAPGEYELTATLPDQPDWLGRRVVTVERSEVAEIEFQL